MSRLPRLPPLAALFLTHFHDLKGQEVSYYVSLDGEFVYTVTSQLVCIEPQNDKTAAYLESALSTDDCR